MFPSDGRRPVPRRLMNTPAAGQPLPGGEGKGSSKRRPAGAPTQRPLREMTRILLLQARDQVRFQDSDGAYRTAAIGNDSVRTCDPWEKAVTALAARVRASRQQRWPVPSVLPGPLAEATRIARAGPRPPRRSPDTLPYRLSAVLRDHVTVFVASGLRGK
jgi:hypothetical protein